jgi:hypothetical protein
VLPSDPQPGPLRRLLHYFGLANLSDDRLRRLTATPAARNEPVERDETGRNGGTRLPDPRGQR